MALNLCQGCFTSKTSLMACATALKEWETLETWKQHKSLQAELIRKIWVSDGLRRCENTLASLLAFFIGIASDSQTNWRHHMWASDSRPPNHRNWRQKFQKIIRYFSCSFWSDTSWDLIRPSFYKSNWISFELTERQVSPTQKQKVSR